MNLNVAYRDAFGHVSEEFNHAVLQNEHILKDIIKQQDQLEAGNLNQIYKDDLGWLDCDQWVGEEAILHLLEKAQAVRNNGDVFVLIGVGGSNQGARAVIRALQQDKKPEVIYAGNNISAHYANQLLQKLEGKSVYINVIAKNFETLEPGIGFRILRKYLEDRYGNDAKTRITVTGTTGSSLHQLAIKEGYDFLVFPGNIGGRYSVLSDVGLFPMAVAGIDIKALLQGAKDMRAHLMEREGKDNIALTYATYRNLLLGKGFDIEMMALFEPQLSYFAKWWIQLFAESEGKDGKGIFPVAVNYSEDLHSVGQYVQDGQKIIFETFLEVEEQNSSIVLNHHYTDDNFNYLDGKDFWDINKAAFDATIETHSATGIPCVHIKIPRLDAYYFGQLFYFFEFSCYLSGVILEVNPFDQPGVEAYKKNMFLKLGKTK